MYIYDQIAEVCQGLNVGSEYEYAEIVDYIHQVTGITKGSIIPSDYCYNKTNKGADGDRFRRWKRLFIAERKGKYTYVGEGYYYTGKVIYAKSNEIYGFWMDGVFNEA